MSDNEIRALIAYYAGLLAITGVPCTNVSKPELQRWADRVKELVENLS